MNTDANVIPLENKMPKPRRAYRHLSERDVLEACQSPRTPIALEVGRLVVGYIEYLRKQDDSGTFRLPEFLRLRPRWPIEAVARKYTFGVISDTGGRERSFASWMPGRTAIAVGETARS